MSYLFGRPVLLCSHIFLGPADAPLLRSRVVSSTSPSLRRIMSEWKTVQAEGLAMGEGENSVAGNSTETFRLKPVGNMFEWHFTFLGAKGSLFEGGLYHGSIILPPDYPLSGPSVRLLNKNQRFKVGARICLSASEYHQETWQPSWTVSSLVAALVAHMTEPAAEIGAVQIATPSQKRLAALRSRSFECPICRCRHSAFPKQHFPPPKKFKVEEPTGPGKDEGRASGERGARRGAALGSQLTSVDNHGLGKLGRTLRLLLNKRFFVAVILLMVVLYLNQPP
ncbi:unnamed protein product [Choristocarpus tenellus]